MPRIHAAFPSTLLLFLVACTNDVSPPAALIATNRIDTVSTADGAEIVYEVSGDSAGKPAVVLVHCWSCDRGYWYAQVEDLAKDYRVAAIDLAGHGGSYPGTREEFTTSAFASDVAAVVGDLGWEHIVLVGHSMGGGVIVEAAHQMPGNVRGLVWIDAFHRLGGDATPQSEVDAFFAPFDSNFVEQVQRFVRSMFPPDADSAVMNRVALDMSSAPPAVAMSAMRNAFEFENRVARRVDELDIPIVAINADLFPTDTASMNAHDVHVIVMPGVGHFLHMERPGEFNAVLRDALASIPQ